MELKKSCSIGVITGPSLTCLNLYLSWILLRGLTCVISRARWHHHHHLLLSQRHHHLPCVLPWEPRPHHHQQPLPRHNQQHLWVVSWVDYHHHHQPVTKWEVPRYWHWMGIVLAMWLKLWVMNTIWKFPVPLTPSCQHCQHSHSPTPHPQLGVMLVRVLSLKSRARVTIWLNAAPLTSHCKNYHNPADHPQLHITA